MGYGTQLLYWEPILTGYVRQVPDCKIFVTKDKATNGLPLPFEPVLRRYLLILRKGRNSRYNKAITLAHPSVLYHLYRYHPKVLVISEFGLLSIYGVLISLLQPGCRVLLLVESDPRSVTGSHLDVRYWFRRLICRVAHIILTNNRAGKQYLEKRLGVPQKKIIQAPYLVSKPAVAENDAPAFENEQNVNFPDLKGRLVFLYVGQVNERKGIDYLIQAAARLDRLHRDSCMFWILGDGALRGALESMVVELGLQDSFHFFGSRRYSELPYFYRSADVFVFPTLNDYRALVGFEAASYGLPLLLSQWDGAAEEIVRPGENGYIFNPLDIDQFAKYLVWFIDNKDRLSHLRQLSKSLSERFTVEHAVQNLVDATARCLEK